MEKIGSEEIMTYKAGDLVYFDGDGYKGVGKIVSQHMIFMNYYLVHSTQVVLGHYGTPFAGKQDNKNNWWFYEDDLKPFTKKEGQKYKVLRDDFDNFKNGDIVTLHHIDDDCVSYYKKGSVKSHMYDLDHDKCELEFYEDAPTEVEATHPSLVVI